MELKVKLETFEGPLDLLLHLIDVNKMNIFDIQIAVITEQYLEYMEQINVHNMDLMSEFLVMAASLLKLKSQMLLPKEEKEEDSKEESDPRSELVAKLLEYKLYKYAAEELKGRQLEADRIVFKPKTIPFDICDYKEEIDTGELVKDLTLDKLQVIFADVLKRREDKVDPIRSRFGKIEKEEANLSQKIIQLQEYGLSHKRFSFREFLNKQPAKMDVIVSFLGILELMKIGRVNVEQDKLFDDIIIDYLAEDIIEIDDTENENE